jgi:RHS repeat-associated protein
MSQPLNTITDYDYDTQDNLSSVTDPNGNITQYYNDDFGRKNQTTSPDTGITDYLYDEGGNLTQRFDANETVVNYTYDALNRLTAIQFPSDPNQNITFTYDSTSVTYGIGRLTGRTDPSGSYTFYYDAHGNLNKEEKTIGSILYTTQYTYNDNNILTSITYPTGRTITYTPDQVGRISQVSTTLNGNPKTLASTITYLPYGGITGLTYGNGLSFSQGYDNQYRISSITAGSILNLTFGYDPNGNITSVADAINPSGGEPLENPEAYSYQQGTNRLTHIEGTPSIDYGYDENGNIATENTWTYVYDLSNQLIRVLDGTNQIAEYTYNGSGQRIKKVTQTETRIFHYDLAGHLIAETNQNGQMLAEYVYLGVQLLSMIRPGEVVYYYHNDHLGTPQVLTNDSQTISWKAVYKPFGEAVPSIQTVENPFRFPGQYYDPETGLHYNYFRYYNPQAGRYITPDPIGLEGGINLFVYVDNNPLSLIDPFGLQTKAKERAYRCGDLCAEKMRQRINKGACPNAEDCFVCCGEFLGELEYFPVAICETICVTGMEAYKKLTGRCCK